MPESIEYSLAAQRKLDETYSYISGKLDSPKTAASTVAKIIDRIAILKDNPDVGPRLSSRIDNVPKRFADTRFLVCGNFIAVYEHDEDTIQVLGIYHGLEDFFGRILSEVE
jgi:plasmid stabilization system protein ParE